MESLEQNIPPSEHGFKLFGDKGYTAFPPYIMVTMKKAGFRTFNKNMASMRCAIASSL